jgi:DNA primase
MASRIPQAFIDELLARTDIAQLIDQHVPLKRTGSNYSARCPFHDEKTPSFSVSGPKQFYYCFGCGASGNAIGFLMNYLSLGFPEAVEQLAGEVGLEVPRDGASNQPSLQPLYDLMEKACRFYEKQLGQNDVASDYVTNKRGLSAEVIERFHVGFAPAGWENLLRAAGKEHRDDLVKAGMAIRKDEQSCYDRFRERVMFPIRDRRGRVVAFGGRVLGDDTPKYLNSPETPVFHKSQELYGLFEVLKIHRKPKQLLVVEGYMDVVALAQAGVDYAVATLGTAITSQHMQRLFKTCNNITFCLDGDRAGRQAAWRAVQVVLPLLQEEWQLKFMFLPEGEDPDTLVKQEGNEKFTKRVERAHNLSAFFMKYLAHDCDMSALDGRARFAKLAVEHIKTIPSAIIQQMLVEAVAKNASIDVTTLQKMIAGEVSEVQTAAPRHKRRAGKLTPLRKALVLLVQHPELAQHCPDHLPNIEETGWQLLHSLLDLLKDKPSLTTGAILEHWRDKPDADIISKLAIYEHIVPEGGLVAEFQDIINYLKQQGIERHIEQLIGKARQQVISAEERAQLQQLLEQRDG